MKRPMERRSPTPLDKMTVTTIAFPPKLHARLRDAAYIRRVVLAQIVRAACEEWLDREEKNKPGR